MSVDAETVRRVAHLARVAVAEDEVEHLRGELNAMLAFVEQLGEVDVKDVEPMTSVTPMAMKMRNTRSPMAASATISSEMLRQRRITFSSFPKWWNDVPCL